MKKIITTILFIICMFICVNVNAELTNSTLSCETTTYRSGTLTWKKIEGATGYKIYRSTTQTSGYKLLQTVKGADTLNYVSANLVTNTTYYYKVRPYILKDGKYTYGPYSNVITIKLTLPTPVATGYNSYFRYAKISYTSIVGATGYRISRATSEDGTYKILGYTTSTSYYDKTALEGKTYYYKVRAYRKINGKRYYSASSLAVSSVRENDSVSFRLSSTTYNQIHINIIRPYYLYKYNIYRATSSTGTYKLIGTATPCCATENGMSATYVDKEVSFNKTYYYKVKAVHDNLGSYSGYHRIKSKLSTPNVNVYKEGNSNVIGLDPVSGSSGYEIYRSYEGGTFKKIKTSTFYLYSDASVTKGEELNYAYKVRAYKIVNGNKIYGDFSRVPTNKIVGNKCFEYDPKTNTITKFYSTEYNLADTLSCKNSTVVVPAKLYETYIYTIGTRAFSSLEIEDVTISSGIRSIGSYAFSGNRLRTVYIPNTVTSIGENAFINNNLECATIGSSVKSIGASAFSKSNNSNSLLSNIHNLSAAAFNWSIITDSATLNQSFVTGTITHGSGNINVDNKISGNIDVNLKPILYLYPTETTKVNVTLNKDNLLLTTYPKYNNGWEVTAHSNGDLYDSNDKYYYGLYWDENYPGNVNFSTGFYVTKDNAIDFLEEKLSILGLNDRERNEFIMFWLPILENNEKSLVYFEQTEERELNNKINITPEPDSLLRILIHIKKVDKYTEIKEEKLNTFNRTGFAAIEWGGVIH